MEVSPAIVIACVFGLFILDFGVEFLFVVLGVVFYALEQHRHARHHDKRDHERSPSLNRTRNEVEKRRLPAIQHKVGEEVADYHPRARNQHRKQTAQNGALLAENVGIQYAAKETFAALYDESKRRVHRKPRENIGERRAYRSRYHAAYGSK